MRIIALRTLRSHWEKRGRDDSKLPLRAWYREASQADWHSPTDVKAMYWSASVIGSNRIVFNIAGNKYRLIVRFNYKMAIGYVRFIGTHAEYDQVDVETI